MLIAAGVLLLLCICLVTLGGIFAAGVRRASAEAAPAISTCSRKSGSFRAHLPVIPANVTKPADVKYLPRRGWRPSA